jgi:hypothetical protein
VGSVGFALGSLWVRLFGPFRRLLIIKGLFHPTSLQIWLWLGSVFRFFALFSDGFVDSKGPLGFACGK